MIGLLFFTHGTLCSALLTEGSRLGDRRDQVCCLSMSSDESMEALTDRVVSAISSIDDGSGVIAFLDVAGGTPWNVCGFLRRDRGLRIRRISGGGVPVVIKALQDRGEHTALESWADELTQYARTHVIGD